MTQSLSKDGQTTPTGNLPMGGFKLTGLADGAASSDSIAYGQAAKLSGNNTFTGDQIINGSVSLSGDLTIAGAVVFTSGSISVASLTVTSVASVASLTALNLAVTSGIVVGAASGGNLGAGIVNAKGFSIDGNPISTAGLPVGYIDGLVVSNDGTDANNDLDIAAGSARDDGDTANMVLASALVKRLDATWVVGTNQGGLDAGVEAISTWYYGWLIERSDTGVVDVLFSASATAPTMPANYDLKRLIFAFYNNGSGNIAAFHQRTSGRLRTFMWDSPVADVDDDNPGSAAVNRTLSVPPLVVLALINLGIFAADGIVNAVYASATDQTNLATQPQGTGALTSPGATVGAGVAGWNFGYAEVWADTSSQIRSRCAATSANSRLGIVTLGWAFEF